jgi:hypothetical protein
MLNFFNIERVRGVVVTRIMERSPGAQAGLKRGNVILSLKNNEVSDKTDYSERVSTYPVENTIYMVILRDGKEESVSLKVSFLSIFLVCVEGFFLGPLSTLVSEDLNVTLLSKNRSFLIIG